MKTTVGLFTSRADAERAARDLGTVGLGPDRINLLTPGTSTQDLGAVPTTETEQPGMGSAIGGVVGGAVGAAGGMSAAAATAVVPGVGPVIALGVIAGALLAAGGAAVGGAIEDTLSGGVPKDELFLYRDALRRGRTVVIVVAEDEAQAEAARDVLSRAGAESLDAARDRWWIGLRTAEAEHYATEGRDFSHFERDEPSYRRGFEAALDPNTRARPYADVVEYLRTRHPDVYRDEAFQRGYERGRAYHLGLRAAA